MSRLDEFEYRPAAEKKRSHSAEDDQAAPGEEAGDGSQREPYKGVTFSVQSKLLPDSFTGTLGGSTEELEAYLYRAYRAGLAKALEEDSRKGGPPWYSGVKPRK